MRRSASSRPSAAIVRSIGGDMVTLLAAGLRVAVDRIAPEMPTLVLSASLLTMTVGLWWWVEDEMTL